jgi:hypothetical protein
MKSLLVSAQYPDAEVTRYRHWESGTEASVVYEATRLAKQSPQLLIAKSLGTVIAATAFCLHEFRPAIAVLIGTPYTALESNEVQFLRHFAAHVDTMFIQQAQDPGGSAVLLATVLQVVRGEVVEVPGSDHLYSDTIALASILDRWTKQHLA